jgi:hypothetical protein
MGGDKAAIYKTLTCYICSACGNFADHSDERLPPMARTPVDET